VRAVQLGRPDFRSIMLNPSRLRKNLPKLLLRGGNNSALAIEYDCSRAGCSLVKRQNELRHAAASIDE
jgi:hypothetical protein